MATLSMVESFDSSLGLTSGDLRRSYSFFSCTFTFLSVIILSMIFKGMLLCFFLFVDVGVVCISLGVSTLPAENHGQAGFQ